MKLIRTENAKVNVKRLRRDCFYLRYVRASSFTFQSRSLRGIKMIL